MILSLPPQKEVWSLSQQVCTHLSSMRHHHQNNMPRIQGSYMKRYIVCHHNKPPVSPCRLIDQDKAFLTSLYSDVDDWRALSLGRIGSSSSAFPDRRWCLQSPEYFRLFSHNHGISKEVYSSCWAWSLVVSITQGVLTGGRWVRDSPTKLYLKVISTSLMIMHKRSHYHGVIIILSVMMMTLTMMAMTIMSMRTMTIRPRLSLGRGRTAPSTKGRTPVGRCSSGCFAWYHHLHHYNT